MKIHETATSITIFGNLKHSLNPAQVRGLLSTDALEKTPLNEFKNRTGATTLACLHQTHGIQGTSIQNIKEAQVMPLFTHEGDFLITQTPRVMLGIATADCLPIVALDPVHNAIGIAHAGWRGSVAEIGKIMIKSLQENYYSCPSDILIKFGPAAGVCCYEVDQKFYDQIKTINSLKQGIAKLFNIENNKLYFNLSLLNKMLLVQAGIVEKNIDCSNNVCTICDQEYASYRRDKTIMRQITVISLK